MARLARPLWTLLFALLAGGAYAAPAVPEAPVAPASPIEGVWLDSTQSEITVVPCEQGYCGNISKIVVPAELYAAHKKEIDAIGPADLTDLKNKDPKLRNRPILGLTILTLHPTDQPDVFDGKIYDPESGDTFSGSLTVLGHDKMRLEGCLDVPGANLLKKLLCRDRDWTRVAEPESPPIPMTRGRVHQSAVRSTAAPSPQEPTANEPVTVGNFQ